MRKSYTSFAGKFLLLFLFLVPVLADAQFPAPYCGETFPSSVEPVTKVVFANISNTSPAAIGGNPHEDFTTVLGNVLSGSTYNMAVQGNTDGDFVTYVRVFIDWNNNGLFTDAGESFDIGTITNSTGADGITASADITVPLTATPGNIRMRVSKKYNAYATPCNSSGFGQAEDYTLVVTPPTACSGKPAAGTVNAPLNTCAAQSFTLSLTGTTLAAGLTYQWQQSPNNTTWSDISGATNSSLTTTQSVTTYYRAKVICAAVPASDTSNAVQVVSPALISGTFTINSAVPTGGSNFQTFTEAVNHIQCGINGPVVFNVAAGSGPYNEQVTIPAIGGTSNVNRITFNGNGTTLAFNSTNSASRSGFLLNGADYITIDSLTIDGSAGTYAWGITLTGQADSNIVRKCNIIIGNLSSTSTNYLGVAINGSATTTAVSGNNGNGNQFLNNTITGGYYGFYFYGNSGSSTQNINNIVVGNIVSDFYTYGSYNIYMSTGLVVSKNNFSRPSRTNSGTTAGVYVTTGSIGASIEKNRVHNMFDGFTSTSTFYGIYVGSAATAALPNKVINNLVYNVGGNGTVYGIYNTTSPYLMAYHNTISLDGQIATTGTAYGFYQTGTAAGIDFRNNLISVTRSGTGIKRCLYFVTTASSIVSNRNILFMNAPSGTDNQVGQYGGTSYLTIGDWRAANSSAYDQQSLGVDPLFVNPGAGDYTPSDPGINGLGANVGVTTDILENPRTISPDPGAFEFSVTGLDGALSWVSPLGPTTAGLKTITVSLSNTQTTTITSAQIAYSDGTNVVTQTFTGLSIAAGASQQLSFTTQYNLTQTAKLRAYINLVNGVPDNAQSNDTTAIQNLCLQISGNYTINNALPTGGNNFNSFTDAAAQLACGGVNGPVMFTVEPSSGPYNENVIITPVAGASATNTVTFKGSLSTLSFNTTDANNRTAFVLNGADHIIIDSLIIDVSAGTYGWGIALTGQADSNRITNCQIINNTSSTATNFMGIIINGSVTGTAFSGNNGNGNVIANNMVNGGYYGIYTYGSTATYNKWNTITNNTVQGFYLYGIYAYGNDSVTISKNDISRPTRTAVSTGYGIYASSLLHALLEKNRIHNMFDGDQSSTSSCYPLYIAGSGASATEPNIAVNNLVYNINNGGGLIYGIYGSGYNNWNYYHNTVVLDDANATAGTTYGIYVNGTGINVKNNLVYISRGGTGTKYNLYYATTGVGTSNNNVLVMSSSAGTTNSTGFFNSGYVTLADWQAANSMAYDQLSTNADPMFVNPGAGNYQPSNALAGDLGAALGVTTDITGAGRSMSTPDAGAYEFTAPPCTGSFGGSAVATNNSLCGSGSTIISASGYSNGSQIVYQWQSSTDNFGTNITDIAGANSPLQVNTGNLTMTTYYRMKVTCAASSTTGYSNIVQVSVTPSPTVTITPTNPAAVCAPATVQLNLGTTSATSPIFQWKKGGSDISGAYGNSYQANASGSYALKVTDGVSNCSTTSAASVVTINPVPSTVAISPAAATVCNTAQQLTAAGGSISGVAMLQEDFNSTAPGWTITNNSSGANAALTTWMFQPDGWVYNASYPDAYHSNDLTQFIHLNSDAGGSGSTTNAILQSPAFSTVGFTTATLTFYQFYRYWASGDVGVAVEVSTNGTTWSALQSFIGTDMGAYASFALTSINMSAYLNQPTVYIRFRYQANWGYWWAIDNVSVKGDQTTSVTWSPLAGLFTNAAATTAYTGGAAGTVYAKPAANTTYTATATSVSNCTSTQTVAVTYDCAIPVTLVNFAGEKQGNVNRLHWTTATEVNNVGFGLERSADGRNFSKLVFAPSMGDNGNSTRTLSYEYYDEKPLTGNGYYRLKQMDKDGKFTYSNIVLIKGDKVKEVMISSLYPNPADREVTLVISSPTAEKVSLVVTNITGKVINRVPVALISGDNVQQLNVAGLASGTYFIKAVCASGCESQVQKFVKQ